MTSYYSRIITENTEKFGLCLGCHADSYVASKKLDADRKKHSSVVVVESDKRLKSGSYYPDLANAQIKINFDNHAVSLMIEVIEHRLSGKAITGLVERLDAVGLSIDDIEAEYGEQALNSIKADEEMERKAADARVREKVIASNIKQGAADFSYSFPAVKGIQAGKTYFTAQVPYKALVKLFRFDEEDCVPAELRAQRNLNEGRAKKIGEYMTSNPDSYVLPAITASVDSAMAFTPVMDSLGTLQIPMDAVILINDGQHRRRGIEFALQENKRLGNETIAVTLFFDQGLARSQQMFSDINQNQVKPSSSLHMVYNHRDQFSAWVMSLLDEMPRIKDRIEMDNASVGAKSLKLWSIIAFRKFIEKMFGINARWFNDCEPDKRSLELKTECVKLFFAKLEDHLPNFKAMLDYNISAYDVRSNFVIGHAVFLEALAIMGNKILQGDPKLEGNFSKLKALESINVSRTHPTWQNRCVLLGKMNKSSDGIKSTAAALCLHVDVKLDKDLESINNQILAA